MMTLIEVAKILEAKLICGEDKLEQEIHSVTAADLMSDLLAFSSDRTLLLTGLVHSQVIRTAELIDIVAIVFMRNKKPTQEMVTLASQKGIPLLVTRHALYESCGLLYSSGIKNSR
jgi:predicted transcriptional regulator